MTEKDFDSWNEQKKDIDAKQPKLYHPKEIWWSTLGLNIGFEQNGKGNDYQRPVLILRAFSKFVCLVIPLSSSPKSNPYYLKVGVVSGRECFAIISQIRLIDVRRLVNKIMTLDDSTFNVIRKATRDLI